MTTLTRVLAFAGWSSTTAQPGSSSSYVPSMLNQHPVDLLDSADTTGVFTVCSSNGALGAWFVRDANQVPAPATLSLFGLGLASMWISRQKKHAAKL